MKKILPIILIMFFVVSFCYGDSISFKNKPEVKGTIVCRDNQNVYIYTEEGLKKVSYKDIVLVTNNSADRIEISEEVKKEIEKIKTESEKRIEQASKDNAAAEDAKWKKETEIYDTPAKRKDIHTLWEATKNIQGKK